jgi:hypothetical protein
MRKWGKMSQRWSFSLSLFDQRGSSAESKLCSDPATLFRFKTGAGSIRGAGMSEITRSVQAMQAEDDATRILRETLEEYRINRQNIL